MSPEYDSESEEQKRGGQREHLGTKRTKRGEESRELVAKCWILEDVEELGKVSEAQGLEAFREGSRVCQPG